MHWTARFFLVDVVIHDRALIRTSHNKNGGIFQSRYDWWQGWTIKQYEPIKKTGMRRNYQDGCFLGSWWLTFNLNSEACTIANCPSEHYHWRQQGPD